MQKNFGISNEDFIILHGGAGPGDPKGEQLSLATDKLIAISNKVINTLAEAQAKPIDYVTQALMGMEEDPMFNAGYGACLQADGVVRLTAALMDGQDLVFSGVINVDSILHPSLLAKALQKKEERVISSPGAEHLARQLNLPVANIVSKEALRRWYEEKKNAGQSGESKLDTVGCVVKIGGQLAAGTSTGGRLNVVAGRVSDAATVAGTYASTFAAVSLTGVGEDIVDEAVAARLETRVRDGMTLKEASEKCFLEALGRNRQYGWIALSAANEWTACFTTEAMSFVVMNLKGEILKDSN